MSTTHTASSTYTVADVENVFRRFCADIIMIADSTGAITRLEAENYAHDAEYLAKRGYLEKIDVTLLSAGVEKKAAVYRINEQISNVTSARPGGVLWPRVDNAFLRVIISPSNSYTDEIKVQTRPKLKFSWSPSAADTSHLTLSKSASRTYASNTYGLNRDDLN